MGHGQIMASPIVRCHRQPTAVLQSSLRRIVGPNHYTTLEANLLPPLRIRFPKCAPRRMGCTHMLTSAVAPPHALLVSSPPDTMMRGTDATLCDIKHREGPYRDLIVPSDDSLYPEALVTLLWLFVYAPDRSATRVICNIMPRMSHLTPLPPAILVRCQTIKETARASHRDSIMLSSRANLCCPFPWERQLQRIEGIFQDIRAEPRLQPKVRGLI
ncbi:hypothetical protein PAXRUDRAFT_387319 [Paxillus rubicundulus Ve08.2h10]|uniref:Uncharacterized protein n=1 Tax=Paxillus rubicundulus Ve08.2h10 TaxID=930991 RepID=A0A0D0DH49_9AGAM|nr:hypothetical protein PAXRUDRAFT_387319 [Paxillus rubicundulus Ve08.2h10]